MPDWTEHVRRRLDALELPPEREAEIAEEIGQHLEERYRELRAGGVAEAEAREAVLADLDGSAPLALQLSAVEPRAPAAPVPLGAAGRGASALASLGTDVRDAIRSLRRNVGFTLVAGLTLALGIGACTLIFSVVEGVLLRPLPYPEPERIVVFWGTAPEKGLPEVAFPGALVAEFRDRARTVEALAGFQGAGFNLTGGCPPKAGGCDPERIEGISATADFFRVLGVRPLVGRTFAPGEDTPNAARVIVLSHALWRRRFGADSAIVGRAITLNGAPTTVIGVMPAGFDFPYHSELWVPAELDPTNLSCWCNQTIARARPGRTPEHVRRDIASVADEFGMRRGDPNAKPGGSRIVAVPLAERVVGKVKAPLWILLGAVAVVLLIACANIANLMLARTGRRAHELAVRCCLGASPSRIAAQLVTESVVLALLGGAAGASLSLWGVEAIRRLPPAEFPRVAEVRLDATTLLFAIALGLITGVLCALAPAWRASRVALRDAVHEGARGSTAKASRALGDGFVVAQFALSLVLLVGAALLLRSYQRLLAVDPGYRPESVLTARLELPYPRYDSAAAVRAFYERLIGEVAAVPGVRRVGVASRVPLSGGNSQSNVVAEGHEPKPDEPVRVANVRTVSPGYFEAIGTPILRGRGVEVSDDRRSSLRVVVVDEALARHFWPGESGGAPRALGKRLRYQGDTTSRRWMTVVGVVPNIKHNRLDEQQDLQLYEPFAWRPSWTNYLVVRSDLPPDALTAQIRGRVASLDPTLPLFEVQTLQSTLDRSLSTRRLMNAVLAAFAGMALLLAAIGVYGVMSLSVSGRIREFGIRLALGARPAAIARQVLRHGLTLTLAGVGLGLAGAVGATRFLRALLFGVGPLDWVAFTLAGAVLTAAALCAGYLPARRATRADPIIALRAD